MRITQQAEWALINGFDMITSEQEVVTPSQLEWRQGDPYSCQYGDVYFSDQNGVAECEHVFIGGNFLLERWRTSPENFSIAETGFGSGLNFLVACKKWLELTGSDSSMHYFSVEKHPLRPEDLSRVLAVYPQLAEVAKELLAAYPSLVSGVHSSSLFSGRVRLQLAFMDVAEWLSALNIEADAWFLDGFAPSRNPEMWSRETIQGVAANSRKGGSFATFTVAGSVRRELASAGFKMEKMPGYGRKREALRGSL